MTAMKAKLPKQPMLHTAGGAHGAHALSCTTARAVCERTASSASTSWR